jgi:signal transduction histidine kinase
VLINLVDNALKYTAVGFVKITLGVQKNEQNTQGDAGTHWPTPNSYSAIFLSVQDSGPGLSEAQLESVFEPFNDVISMGRGIQSINTPTEHTVPSTGLGMAIVKSLADANRWDIQVQSQLQEQSKEHGTTFTLILPVQP